MKNLLLTFAIILFCADCFSQVVYIQENFNDTILPVGWSTTAVTGGVAWSFGVDGSAAEPGLNNLDGTPMAFFDDDALGSNSTGNEAILLTPVFNNTSQTKTTLEFDYNFKEYGLLNSADTFKVDVYDGTNWVNVFYTASDDCGSWLLNCANRYPHANIDISAFSNVNCQVRFTYSDGINWAWHVGVDNVEISSEIEIDLGVMGLISPKSSCSLSSNELITVEVINYGVDTINSFQLQCDINKGAIVLRDTANFIFAPKDTVSYTFNSTVDFSSVGIYSIDIVSVLSTDTFPANDSLKATIQRDSMYMIPYLDDFEGAANWKMQGLNNSWMIGTPSNTLINSAVSGSNAIVTNLASTYNNFERSHITSQCFDFSNLNAPKVSFQLNYDIEKSYDSLWLEYSIDGGDNWTLFEEEFSSSHWYSSEKSWQGTSNGWLNVSNTLVSLKGQSSVKFRFVFESDLNVTKEGAGIDDFIITENDSVDIKLAKLVYPSIKRNYLCRLGQEVIEIELENKGMHFIDSTFLFYQINGGIIVSDTLLDTIPAFSKTTVKFTAKYDFSGLNTHNINVWAKVKGDTIASNDSLVNLILHNTQLSTSNQLPYVEEFNSPDFKQGRNHFHVDDSIGNDWMRSSRYTWRTANSDKNRVNNKGPIQDYNGAGSNFMYAESTHGGVGDTATLESACINLANELDPVLEFRYHRYDFEDLSPLFVEVYDGISWVQIDSLSGASHSSMEAPWNSFQTDLKEYSNRKIKIRFRTEKESCCKNNIAIDDVKIYNADSIDVGVSDYIFRTENGLLKDTVQVIVKNNGILPIIDSIPIYYTVNSGTLVTETIRISNNFNSGDSINFTFSQIFDFSLEGEYNIKVWTGLNSDSNQINDTVKFSYSNYIKPAISYLEDFESFVDDTCDNSSRYAYRGSYGNEFLNGWKEKSKEKYTWQVQDMSECSYGTGSANTGPYTDHTAGTGKLIYAEASGVNFWGSTDTAIFESPYINFNNKSTAGMRFWYHKFGSSMGDLLVDVYANGVWNLNIDSIIGQSHFSHNDPWKQKVVNLSQFAGQNIKVRFRAISLGNPYGDMAIDDVEFYIPIPKDAKVQDLNILGESCISNSGRIEVILNNYGLDTITAHELKINYQVNNQQAFIDSNLFSIPPDSNLSVELNLSNLFYNVTDTIIVWVELNGDTNNFNDTLLYLLDSPVRAPDYTEGFENIISLNGQCGNYNTSLNLAWEVDSNDQWVVTNDSICNYGTSGATPTSLTGPDSAYAGHGFMYFEPAFNSVLDTAILRSTCIDLTNDSISYLEFYYHMYGAGTGKLYIEVSVNGTISRLDSIVGQQQTSMSSPWGLRVINLNQFSGDIIQIRFIAIESSGSNSNEGSISIDNFRVYNSFPVLLDERTLSKNLQLYPNPTNGEFVLVGNDFTNSEIKIHLVDLNGRVIESRIIKSSTNSIKEIFNLSNQPNGVYLISVQSKGELEVKKIVLSRN